MPTETLDLSLDAVGERADVYYNAVLRARAETPENIGKYLLLDMQTNL